MPRRTLKDRLLTPPVARAMMSPLGMLLFGGATAGAIVVGAPLLAAFAVGAAAWAGRVAVAVPRDSKPDRVEPFVLADPWRGYVVSAQESKARFDGVVRDISPGPLRERLAGLADRLSDGIDESWRIAKRGNDISNALARLDTVQAHTELAELRAEVHRRGHGPTASEARTIEALEAQVASAERLSATAVEARDRLRLLDARYDELVARAVEVSVGAGDSARLDHDVGELVTELESLRLALDETERASSHGQATMLEPPAAPRPSPSP